MNRILTSLTILSGIGLLDAAYLTYEHYADVIPPCTTNILFADCGKVLNSPYATIYGIPVSLLGIVYYLTLTTLIIYTMRNKKTLKLLFFVTLVGFLMSLYFVYIQLFVLQSICIYCMVSAFISATIFLITSYLTFYGKK